MYYFTVNRWQQQQCFLSNCYSRLSHVRLYSDLRVTDYQEKQNWAAERAYNQVATSLSPLVISLASGWTHIHSIHDEKCFFFSCLVSEISRSVWRDEMKCSELDLLLQHSQAPTAMELVTGVWLLHLSNPENNWFLQREGKDESCRTRKCTRHFIMIKTLSFSISNNSWSNLIGIQVISFQKIEILNN